MDEKQSLKNKTISGLVWTFMERIGAQGVSFIVSLVLARLLLPEQYGIIALVTVIINICNVFVTSGFSSALIQKKDVDDIDFSTVLYFGFVFSVVLYILLFFAAPMISSFFEYEKLVDVIRVMGIGLVVASINSVQRSMVSRRLQFRKFFVVTFVGTMISAVVGIVMAIKGLGVWALVGQYLTNVVIDTIMLAIVNKWMPKLVFSFKRLGKLFSYGWKILVSSIISVVFEDIRTLIIGKKYTSTDLALYNKGRQVPNLLVSNVNSSIQSVMFPVLSQKQDDKAEVKRLMRRSIKTSAYLTMPMMFGFAACAEIFVRIVLTDNWIECVPYIQIACVSMALMPLQTANIQALYALGRSDIILKIEIIKKVFSLSVIIFTCFFGVKAIALGGIVISLFALLVNVFPNRKLLGYGYREQVKDILPFVVMSAVMGAAVIGIGFIPMNMYLMLFVQIASGVLIYVGLSAAFKVESFYYLLNIIKTNVVKVLKRPKDNSEH
ncbi:MAG: lipopolysaccharide biosynthesis protein [Clostridia bacterium]|nr:lipopolysaccharide biosynthesis protein [Clostridia bacterium]